MEKLSIYALELGNAMYRVHDLQYGFDEGFRKNNAYRIKSDIDDMVYPYRGSLKSFKKIFEDPNLLPGIYSLEGRVPTKIQVKAAVGKDRSNYSPEAVFNLRDAARITKRVNADSIINVKMNVSNGAAWMPELDDDDDATSLMLKSAIRLKRMVFADYAPRLEEDAVGKGQGSRGVSAKSNSKRAIEKNHATSMGKMVYYCNAFDLDPVIGLRDRPGARDPMLEEGQVMVFYPCSEPYALDNTITVNELKERIDMAHLTSGDDEDDMFGPPF